METGEGDDAQGLVPKRRFPEFLNAGSWDFQPLREVAIYSPDKVSSASLPDGSYLSTESILPDFSGIKRAATRAPVARVGKFLPGDILVSNIRPYLKKIWLASFSGGASNDVLIIRAKAKIDRTYLATLLKNERFVDYVSATAKGVKMPRGDTTSLMDFPCPIPPNTDEQQKIADCLSSLDAVIAAEGDRLATLNDYKDGLKQALFPAPGQTTPRLRFPEFQNAGEWKETTIGEVGSFYYGKSAPKWSLEEGAPTPCVRYGELYTKFGPLITETISKTNIAPENLRFSKGGEILVPRVGEKPDDFGRNCSLLTLSGIAIGEMISVFETDQNALFFTFYFRHLYQEFAKVVEGQNVKNLYYTELEPIKIYRPSMPEQGRIAQCLLILEQLVEASKVKLADLRSHKSGLMQQLFPSPAEVSA